MARPWRWLLFCLLGALVLAGGTWLWMHHRARGTFEENQKIIDRLCAELSATPIQRPVPGMPIDVDALEIHEEVYRQVSTLSDREREVIGGSRASSWDPEGPVTEDERLALLARTRPMLDAMRPALNAIRVGDRTRRRIGDQGYDRSQLQEQQAFLELVAMHVRYHLAQGEVDEALDLAVLQWHVGLDGARRATLLGFLVGQFMAGAGVKTIRRILATHEVAPERLVRLAREIEALQAQPPSLGQSLKMEEVDRRSEIAEGLSVGAASRLGLTRRAGLRYLFSYELLAADALDQFSDGFARLIAALDARTSLAARLALGPFAEEIASDPNPLVELIFTIQITSVERCRGSSVPAELLRLTTALARYRAVHGAMPKALADLVTAGFLSGIPPCPYSGAPFMYDGERVWSHGGDGDDDGGRPVPDGEFEEDGDVVYTLRLEKLRAFPWPTGSVTPEQVRFKHVLKGLHGGGGTAELARGELLTMNPLPFGPLISEFKVIEDRDGLDTEQGRTRAGVIDRTLRSMDAVMRVRWHQREPISAAMSAEQARTIALRWVNWWFSGQRVREELDPEDHPEEEESEAEKPADSEGGR